VAITLEQVTLWVAAAVSPLEHRLAADSAEQFLSEIGLPTSGAVAALPQVGTATSEVVQKVSRLVPHIPDLAAAIDEEDLGEIGRILETAAPAVADLVRAVRQLGSAIDAAAGSVGGARAEIQAFASELPQRVFGYLLSVHLEETNPTLHDLAVLFGLIEIDVIEATESVPTHIRRTVRFDRFGEVMADPFQILGELYGWGTPALNWDLFLERLFHLMSPTGFVFLEEDPSGGPPLLRIPLVDIGPTTHAVPGLRATARAAVPEGASLVRPLAPNASWELVSEARIEAGAAIELLPPTIFRILPVTAEVAGKVRLRVTVENPAGGRTVLLGSAAGIRLEARTLRAEAGAELGWQLTTGEATGELVLSVAIVDGRFVLDLEQADGFLSALLPSDGLSMDFSLGLAWSKSKGLHIEGAAGLEVDLPVDLSFGPVRVLSVHLGLAASKEGLALRTLGSASARLGPFAVSIDRVGAETRLAASSGGGNLGVAEIAVAFQPPRGIGLAIDAGVVKGGGFLAINPAGTEYAGVLELTLGPVSIKAIGILTTRIPGTDGWALLLLVFSEFSAVQLGYGFTLNGVGGIVGLQHGIAPAVLQTGLRTGVLDSVLFPANPVANAPQLLGHLRAVFPITPRALTVGPILKIGWSTPPLVTISLGIVLQFDDVLGSAAPPQLTRVVLLGQLKLQAPPDIGQEIPALVKLLVDIVGSYELRQKALAIDARLRDSHIAGLPLTGTLVARARFGAAPSFILAVGGVHPRFTDLPPGLPDQERLGLQLAYDIVAVRIVGYTAVTSNSFQIGAEALLLAVSAGLRIEAHLGFDALFLTTPVFHFTIDFRVGASVRYKSHSLACVSVHGVLSGPGRWLVTGHASFKVLLWHVGMDFEVSWGDQPAAPVPTIAVTPLLIEQLEYRSNWRAELPAGSDALVVLRQPSTNGKEVLAHPLGELSVVQRRVPLGVKIDRLGTSRPSDGTRFEITAVEIGTRGSPGFHTSAPVYRQEHFARGEYLDLSEAEKLSTPSFERFPAGVALSSDVYVVSGSQVSYDPDFETQYLEHPDRRDLVRVPGELLETFAHFGAAASSELRVREKLSADRSLVVEVTGPSFAVADAGKLLAVSDALFPSFTLARQASTATGAKTIPVELAELATS
jgi:hypothetical protein